MKLATLLVMLAVVGCKPPDGDPLIGGELANTFIEAHCSCCEASYRGDGCKGGQFNLWESGIATRADLSAVHLGVDYAYNDDWMETCIPQSSSGCHSGPQPNCDLIPSRGSTLSCDADCWIFAGDRAQGQSCTAHGHRMSDCAPGLECGADRVCYPMCEGPKVAPEGGWCGPERGMWFVRCDEGLACTPKPDWESTGGTCEPAAGAGEACGSNLCAVGLWCFAGSCVQQLPPASACTANEQCDSEVCLEDGSCYSPESPVCGRWGW